MCPFSFFCTKLAECFLFSNSANIYSHTFDFLFDNQICNVSSFFRTVSTQKNYTIPICMYLEFLFIFQFLEKCTVQHIYTKKSHALCYRWSNYKLSYKCFLWRRFSFWSFESNIHQTIRSKIRIKNVHAFIWGFFFRCALLFKRRRVVYCSQFDFEIIFLLPFVLSRILIADIYSHLWRAVSRCKLENGKLVYTHIQGENYFVCQD